MTAAEATKLTKEGFMKSLVDREQINGWIEIAAGCGQNFTHGIFVGGFWVSQETYDSLLEDKFTLHRNEKWEKADRLKIVGAETFRKLIMISWPEPGDTD